MKVIAVLTFVSLFFAACKDDLVKPEPGIDWTSSDFTLERLEGHWVLDAAVREKYANDSTPVYNVGNKSLYLKIGLWNSDSSEFSNDGVYVYQIEPGKTDSTIKYRGRIILSEGVPPTLDLGFFWCEDWYEEKAVTTSWKSCPSNGAVTGTVDSLELIFNGSPIFGSIYDIEVFRRIAGPDFE